MLIFSKVNLAYIAVPKTGTTAISMALKPKSDISFNGWRKHMTAQRFHNKVAPFLKDAFGLEPDRCAVIRDPEEQIRSWYRFRTRENTSSDAVSTSDISFDQFVLDVISDDPPPHAGIGSQWNMLTGRGTVLVHHLFAYERPTLFRGFLHERFGTELSFGQKNVSPKTPAPLDPKTRKKLRERREKEFALYDRVMDADGHLFSQV